MENTKKYKVLSIEELRSFKGFENFTNQQAMDAISSIEKLCILFFELFQKANTELALKTQSIINSNTSGHDNNEQQPIAA